jgi:hypothetical protein
LNKKTAFKDCFFPTQYLVECRNQEGRFFSAFREFLSGSRVCTWQNILNNTVKIIYLVYHRALQKDTLLWKPIRILDLEEKKSNLSPLRPKANWAGINEPLKYPIQTATVS